MPQKKQPKLSVLLPVFNASSSVANAIESVLNQDFTDFELIIIDNNSDTQTLKVVRKYNDARIVLLTEKQQGIAYALNRGLSVARGLYIARMDADDVSFSQRFNQQVAYLDENTNIDLVGTQTFFESSQSNALAMSHFVTWQNMILSPEDHALNRFIDSPIAHPTWMMRKKLVDSCGYYTLDFVPEDYEYLLRVLHNGFKIAKLPEKLLSWTDQAQRAIRNDIRYAERNFDKIRIQYLALFLKSNKLINSRKLVVCGLSKKSKRRAMLLQTFDITVDAFTDVVPRNSPDFILLSEVTNPKAYFVLNFISKRGIRDQIKAHFTDLGFIEGTDLILA
jgi:glycosyltransferase involved in cell wall biosynthesis